MTLRSEGFRLRLQARISAAGDGYHPRHPNGAIWASWWPLVGRLYDAAVLLFRYEYRGGYAAPVFRAGPDLAAGVVAHRPAAYRAGLAVH